MAPRTFFTSAMDAHLKSLAPTNGARQLTWEEIAGAMARRFPEAAAKFNADNCRRRYTRASQKAKDVAASGLPEDVARARARQLGEREKKRLTHQQRQDILEAIDIIPVVIDGIEQLLGRE